MQWKDLTVRQYQEIQDAMNASTDDFDRVCFVITVLFNLTHDEVNNLEPERFFKLKDKVEKLFSANPTGAPVSRLGRYRINYDVQNYKWRQYVEIQHWLKEPLEFNFHLILASAANPFLGYNKSEGHKKRAAKIMNYCFLSAWFSTRKILENLERLNKLFIEELEPEEDEDKSEEELLDENMPEPDFGGTGFEEKWGWIYSTKRIAEHRGITLDEAYELSAIQALNDLQFIKDLQKHEEKLFEDAKRKSQQH